MAYETVVAVFDTAEHAHQAVAALTAGGFSADAISVVGNTIPGTQGGFWSRMFGAGVRPQDVAIYDRALADGGAVLSARVDRSQITHVVSILDSHRGAPTPLAAVQTPIFRTAPQMAYAPVSPPTVRVQVAPVAGGDDPAQWADSVVDLRETAERLLVRKSAKAIEEIRLDRIGSDRIETVNATVRTQQAEIIQLDAAGRPVARP